MGAAEVIALDEIRVRKHWTTLRQRLHERFDRWLDVLEGRLSEPQPTLSEVTQAVWDLRQSLIESAVEAIIGHTSAETSYQPSDCCPQCERLVKSRGLSADTWRRWWAQCR